MAEPFIGEIRLFPFTYAPKDWAFCEGQTISIQQNAALYALLSTTYGGDGYTTFALPDLRGRVPVHFGAGTGLTPRYMGTPFGAELVTLTSNTMPQHNHDLLCTSNAGGSTDPTNAILAPAPEGVAIYNSSLDNIWQMDPSMVQAAGGGQPHANMQPFLALHFCISLKGNFPPRT